MKLLVFAVCALACLTLANTKPCRGNTCGGYNYMYKHQFNYGGGYKFHFGFHAGYANGNAIGGGGGFRGMNHRGAMNGGGRNNGGGRYNGNGYRRNNYCPNCYVRDFGNGNHNANTINIKRRS